MRLPIPRLPVWLLRLLKMMIGVIALLIVALLIWFVTPLIRFGDMEPFASSMVRGSLIALIFLAYLVIKFKHFFVRQRKNEALAKEMASAPKADTPLGQEEVAELSNKFQSALQLLKKVKTKEGGRGSYLYVLPWYAIIGPPGAGKTTALLNSDLHFPLIDSVGASVKGVGGTRNCDWWFTDEAVLLDTAGRYTTQNAQNELDEVEWKGFLALLKKFRSRKPINGLIVSFPVDYLLKLPEAELITHAKFIKQRIHEFQETFKIRFPVYVTLTKTDLLPGFSEFFDDLGKEERSQVWGMTFPLNEDSDQDQDVVPDFLMEFRTLQERIQSLETSRLQAESDVNRREQIYVFPRAFGLLQDPVATFLGEIFKSTRYETQPLLRGVYLTSGTQDGTTLDRVISSLGANFGLKTDPASRRPGKGKAYFLHNLMTKVIFKESGLAGVNVKQERRMLMMHLAGYSAAALLTIGLSSYWLYTYFSNQQLVTTVQQDIEAAEYEINNISAYDHDLLAPVPALDRVRNITTGYADNQEEGLRSFLQMGLYQGDKLGQGANEAYQQLLYKSYLPRVMARLEKAMFEDRSNADALYETLRVYLMLSDQQHFDAQIVQNWFSRDWERTLPKSSQAEQIHRLSAHLEALLEFLPSLPALEPNAELVASARSVLSKQPPARRFYAHLKQDGLNNRELDEFRLVDAVGTDSIYLFRFKNGQKLTSGINGFYTRDAYRKYFLEQRQVMIQNQLTDEWVMGEEYGLSTVGANADMLFNQVENLYLDDYLAQWRGYIESIGFKPVNTNDESLLLLKRLSRDDSPLIGLLKGIKKHTSAEAFTLLPDVDAPNGMMDRVTNVLTSVSDRMPKGYQMRTDNPVVEYFADLNNMIEGSENSAPPIDETLKLLDELYVYMSAMDGSLNRGKAAFQNTSDPNGPSAVLREMDIEASRFPEPLSGFIERVTDNARRLTTTDAKGYMQRRWQNDVIQQCNAMIANRYPFNKASNREATIGDVSAYFGPNGIVETYFNDVMIDYVDTTRRPWQWNSTNGISLGFADEVLNQLEIGRVIRDTFYRNGQTDPNVNFELKPLKMDKSILRMSLLINGQQMTYAHGPQRGKRFHWPAEDSAERGLARLVIVTADGQESITEQGDWALFRLFDEADIKRLDSERYILNFTLNNVYSVSLELRAGSVYNPFLMSELQQVRCQ